MTRTFWQPHEDEVIQQNYQSLSSKEIAQLLPGRSKRAVDHRAQKLGLERGHAAYGRRRDVLNERLSAQLGEPLEDYLKRRYIQEEATYRQLCAELGINTRTLMKRMERYGIQPIDYVTAGNRNYQKNQEVYDQSMSLRNTDEARHKSAVTRQNEWERFASDQAKEIMGGLHQMGLHPMAEYALHRYNIDLAFPDVKLAVEVDGGNWHQTTDKHIRLEEQKEAYLVAHGWTVLRLKTDNPLAHNLASVSSSLNALASTHPR